MADETRANPPTLEDVEKLRSLWLRLEADALVAWGEPVGDGKEALIYLRKDDIWLRYQDAVDRRNQFERAREIKATMELARTNTQLAGSQMWIAGAIAVMT